MTLLTTLRQRIRSANYLRKWVVLGALIGVISGLGAVVFFVALDLMTRLLLGLIAGFTPASPVGEGGQPITDAARIWAVPAIVAAGGLLSGIIVFRLAPEAEGHGTDAAISAFHHGARRIRARIPAVKLVASAITIGAGGSGVARAQLPKSAPALVRGSRESWTSMRVTHASPWRVAWEPASEVSTISS